MSEKKWFAAYTRPRFEKKIARELKEKGIECYLPLLKTMREWSDRKKLIELPLFSSYIFVKSFKDEFSEVLTVQGVVRFVSFEGKPVEIPEKQIENIRWILSSEIHTSLVNEIIPPGALVEIKKGPLIGLKAEMVEYKNKRRVIIRLSELDKSIEIQIPESHVKQV